MRPGPPPPRPPRRAPLGPTPRYPVIPRWGLADRIDAATHPATAVSAWSPTVSTVRQTLRGTEVVLLVTAATYLVQYLLLVVNRGRLLHPIVAAGARGLVAVAGAAAIVAVGVCAVVLTGWLIARRRAAFAAADRAETRSVRALWTGGLLPLVNLLWTPVYVNELARVEERRLRIPIRWWWIAWAGTTVLTIAAILTRSSSSEQGIANNTVLVILAVLSGWATLRLLTRVFDGFEHRAPGRSAHRWVVVAEDRPVAPAEAEPAA